MTVAGLCKLIELGCSSNGTIQQATYRKLNEKKTNSRQTRSKTKGNEEYITVPWLSQAVLIITTEWAGQKERDTQNDDSFDEDSEDEIEGLDDEGTGSFTYKYMIY